MRWLGTFLLGLVFCTFSFADVVPTDITVPVGRLGLVVVDSGGKPVAYEVVGDNLDCFREYDPDPNKIRLRLVGYSTGTAYIVVGVAQDKSAPLLANCKVTIGNPPVPPVPPVPPTPPVPPVPPVPPTPPPIPTVGFRVLILYDSTKLAQMPAAQQNILFSRTFRDLLNSTCVAGTDGKTKEWRIWPVDTDASGESTVWQDALKRPHTSLPWILLSDGKTGYEGPLPANITDATALVKKYSGSYKVRKTGLKIKKDTDLTLPTPRRSSSKVTLPIPRYRKGA